MAKMIRTVLVMIASGGLVLVSMAAAQVKHDFLRTGPPVPPVPDASEDTPVSYTGAVPAPVMGALDQDDSTYNRVLTGCGGLSGVGTAVSYDTITITNNTAGIASFIAETSDQGTPGVCAAIDTFLTAYEPTFNPGAPLTGCVAADDDLGPGNCSRITFTIPVAGTAVIVVSSFANAALFPYQVNFDGTTPVELTHFKVE